MKYLIWGLIAVPLLSVKAIAQPIGYPVTDSVLIATNNTYEKALDEWTDNIFYKLHPQLNRRKIRPNETQYINEWAAIRKVLRDGNLVYERGCGPSYWWHLSEFDTPGRNPREIVVFSSVLNKVADAIFYTRNPDLGYRAIQRSETRLASEWSKIRQGVSLVHPCYY